MNPKKQSPAAAEIHATAKSGGITCIECHKGIAHKLPAGS
jgi:cytochrome c-type protein NapC